MTVTTFDDIVELARPTRPILPEDEDWIAGKIFEAEVLLETRRGDLTEWLNKLPEGPAREKRKDIITMVVNRMIERVVKNPDGLFTETDGNYSYGRDKSLGSGEVYASALDWTLIGSGGASRVRSVRLGLPAWSPRNMSCG